MKKKLVALAGAGVVVGLVSIATYRGLWPKDRAAPVRGPVAASPETELTEATMRQVLTAKERERVDSFEDADKREYFTKLWYYNKDRFTGDPGELLPFLLAAESHRPLARGERETPEWQLTSSRAEPGLSVLGRAWAQAGPFPELRSRLIEAAMRCAADRYETMQYSAACLLIALSEYPPDPLPPEAQATLERLMANDFVAHMINARWKWREQLDHAMVAVGRTPAK